MTMTTVIAVAIPIAVPVAVALLGEVLLPVAVPEAAGNVYPFHPKGKILLTECQDSSETGA